MSHVYYQRGPEGGPPKSRFEQPLEQGRVGKIDEIDRANMIALSIEASEGPDDEKPVVKRIPQSAGNVYRHFYGAKLEKRMEKEVKTERLMNEAGKVKTPTPARGLRRDHPSPDMLTDGITSAGQLERNLSNPGALLSKAELRAEEQRQKRIQGGFETLQPIRGERNPELVAERAKDTMEASKKSWLGSLWESARSVATAASSFFEKATTPAKNKSRAERRTPKTIPESGNDFRQSLFPAKEQLKNLEKRAAPKQKEVIREAAQRVEQAEAEFEDNEELTQIFERNAVADIMTAGQKYQRAIQEKQMYIAALLDQTKGITQEGDKKRVSAEIIQARKELAHFYYAYNALREIEDMLPVTEADKDDIRPEDMELITDDEDEVTQIRVVPVSLPRANT